MKRKCNLELRLVTPSVVYFRSDGRYHPSDIQPILESPNEKQQQLTIFYNGMVASSDATELQAKSIISLANREMEETKLIKNNKKNSRAGVALNSPNYSPTTINNGLSMKRSLQRFLEKRKTRAHTLSPYPYPYP